MMGFYFLRTTRVTPFVWAILTIGVIATSFLYATLIVLGISENISLLISFIILTGLLLALLLVPRHLFRSKEQISTSPWNIPVARRTPQKQGIDNHTELTRQLIQSMELLTQSLSSIKISSDTQHLTVTGQETAEASQRVLQQLLSDQYSLLVTQNTILEQISAKQYETLKVEEDIKVGQTGILKAISNYDALFRQQQDFIAAFDALVRRQQALTATIEAERRETALLINNVILVTDSHKKLVQEIEQSTIELRGFNVQLDQLLRRIATIQLSRREE